MPRPFFGANDVCYILKKRRPKKKLFLAKRACTHLRLGEIKCVTHFTISTFFAHSLELLYRKNWRTHSTPVSTTKLLFVLTSDSCVLTLDASVSPFSTVLTSRKFDARLSLFNFRCLMYSLQIHKQANRTHYRSRGIKCTHFIM